MPTSTAGRWFALNRSDWVEKDLTVGDGDHASECMRTRRLPFGFDDRQAGHRTAAEVIGNLGAAFEQTECR